MEIQRPPVPPPIETVWTSLERAIENTKKVRIKIFEEEKGKMYHDIIVASNEGKWTVEHKFHENCNYADIKALEEELKEQGFEVKFNSGVPRDSLEISWYPKE